MNPTQYGKIATTEEEKAQNRAVLQSDLSRIGISSTQVNGSVIPNTPISTTISADNLSTVRPFNLSQPQVGTGAIGLGSEITSGSNSVIQNLDKQDALKEKLRTETLSAEEKLNKASGIFSKILGTRENKSQLEDQAYSQKNDQGTTVDETGTKLRSLNARINALDLATNEQIKMAQAQKGGTVSGTDDAIRLIQRNAATSKADLYIEKLLAQGDYDSAKSIADRKVAVIMEQEKLDYEKAKFDYENNKDLFTKAEQREFEVALNDRTRALNKQENDLKTIESLAIDALENDATPAIASQMRNAKTVDEAMRIGGQYIGATDRAIKQAQLKEILSKVAADSPEAVQAQKQSESLNQLALVDEIINSPYIDQVFGLKNPFTYYTPGSNEQYVKNQVNQLKGNLSLENRQQLKGSGAISDFEFKILGQAASSLGSNLSNDTAKKELAKIRGVFANAAGLPTKVEIKDPSTGKSVTVSATRETIQQALIDGAVVTYK